MLAVVVKNPGPPEALELTTVADPHPGAGEISIDVAYAGVGFVDTKFRAGDFVLPLPLVPGIEVTGHVREVGAGVTGFRPGQQVGAVLNDFGRAPRAGGYAEIAVAHASMAVALPEGADLARLAAVLVNGVTAWIALRDLARVSAEDDVLVLGASGGLGGTTSRLAALLPARRVIGVVGSEAKVDEAAAECTDVVVAGDLPKALDRLTDGRGVDVVIDPVGGELRGIALDGLAPFGRHLVVGNASGQDTPLSGDAMWLGSRQLLGLSVGGIAHLIPDRVHTALRAVVDLTHRDALREPEPAVVRLDQAAGVHRALESRTAPPKTVLRIAP